MKRAVIVAAIALLGASLAPVWLDVKAPTPWNVAGTVLPSAPGAPNADLATGGRCAAQVRPPSQPEDHAVTRKGWSLVGPYERYGGTSVLLATSSADGMCRPNGYQGFVFVNGAFAGTLSPHLMNARSDASISGLGVELENAHDLSVTFARYADSDPLCCPHTSTNVLYEIKTSAGHALVEPVSAQTIKNTP